MKQKEKKRVLTFYTQMFNLSWFNILSIIRTAVIQLSVNQLIHGFS